MRVTVTSSPRWLTPTGTGLNTSACPLASSGHGVGRVSASGWSDTKRTRRPSWWSGSPSGQTQPIFRRRPEANEDRRSMMSPAVTPWGRSMSARQPGPWRTMGSGKPMALSSEAFRAWLILAMLSEERAVTITSEVSCGTSARSQWLAIGVGMRKAEFFDETASPQGVRRFLDSEFAGTCRLRRVLGDRCPRRAAHRHPGRERPGCRGAPRR